MDRLEEKWESFLKEQGNEISAEIYERLQETAHLFDTGDGTHAKWADEATLGFILVFESDEAEAILAAFHAGVDGVQGAQWAFAQWVASLMSMLSEAVIAQDD